MLHHDADEGSMAGQWVALVVALCCVGSGLALNLQACYGVLGCLSLGGDFYHPFLRPLNPVPWPREKINVKYTVLTRANRMGREVRATNLQGFGATTFDGSKPTRAIIHGFPLNPFEAQPLEWLFEQGRAMLDHGDVNVLVVDWLGGARATYDQAAQNGRVAGLEIAHTLAYLQNNMGLDPAGVHIVGNSLGAHVAGYAGEKFPGLGRITGLDPAGLYFQDLPTAVRLDPSDAAFVDVIHTNAQPIVGFGSSQLSGHLDFFPNGGEKQPGCDLPACSHGRAPEYFTASLTQCPFHSRQCASYAEFEAGLCSLNFCGNGDLCAQMGIDADQWSGVGTGLELQKMFLTTKDSKPFC